MKPVIVLGFVLALLPASVGAKGRTTRITVTEARLETPVHITNPSILERFNVWAGRGTFVTIAGQERQEGDQGFIIDWVAGVVGPPPRDLPRYEVRFFVRYANSATEKLAYVVYYVHDSSSHRGFVYLPGKSDEAYRLNVTAIHRGNNLEGNWFRASPAWYETVERVLGAR
ncbi:MAG TPA: hypothetical protein VK886_16320 [Vicinamibacterales bacterium]|nr:hypothetical protein [Vicinamibacterales bacterium]